MSSSNSKTFSVSGKKPTKFDSSKKSHKDQIQTLSHYRANKCTELLQTSNFPEKSHFSKNGFVNTVIDCYNDHHNLILRPDDVWVAIMTQFSFYINKHEEEFRGKFVDFEGKKMLSVSVPGGLRTAPYDLFVKLMSKEIDQNLVDPDVKKWVLPSFSTTTDNDLVTAGVVFMASMKKYFDYVCRFLCGIPNITLEGTTEDWKDIHGRLEKLKEYKLEKWYDMLERILLQFINAKEGKVDLDFWQKICHYQFAGSGSDYVSGWITAFCVFNVDGDCIIDERDDEEETSEYENDTSGDERKDEDETSEIKDCTNENQDFADENENDSKGKEDSGNADGSCSCEEQDSAKEDRNGSSEEEDDTDNECEYVDCPVLEWPVISTDAIPTGIVEVELLVDDGAMYKAVMFAGHMATEIKNDECTVQPTLGWAIALKPDSDNNAEVEVSGRGSEEVVLRMTAKIV